MRKLLLLYFFIFVQSIFAETIVLRSDEWCPYNCSPKSRNEGYILDVVRESFAKEGITIEYQIWPWAKSIKSAQMGFVAGVIGALKEEVPDFIYPDEEQGISLSCFYAFKESKVKYRNLKDLEGQTIGAIKYYSYGEKIDGYFRENSTKVQLVSDTDSAHMNVRKLLNKNIDLIVEDRNVMDRLLNRMRLSDEVVNVGCEGKGEKVYIAFSPKNPKSGKYAEIVNRAFKNARENGSLESILKKYGLKDWK